MQALRHIAAIGAAATAAATIIAVAVAAPGPSSDQPLPSTSPERVAPGRVAPGRVAPEPSSSAYLSLLPDGAEKRNFLLDCTGCHQLDARTAFPGGQPRSEASWREAIQRMVGFAGHGTSFPVIGEGRDPAATAAWLARHLAEPPSGDPPLPTSFAGIREYDYPYAQDLPHDLMVAPDGRVVITGMFTHRMLVLDPESGDYDEVPIPVPNANPRALDIDDRGDWWVLLGAPLAIGHYRPGDDDWSIHDIGMYPHSVVAREGRVWFNGHFTSDPALAGYLDMATGDVRTLTMPATPAPEKDPIPYGLRVAPDGVVWMTELHGNRLIRFDPATERAEAWLMPTPVSGPRRADIAPDGTVWIPEYAANRLARFDPATETFEEIDLPVEDALPYVVRVDQRSGRVWIGTGAADALLSYDPGTREFSVHPLPTRGALVRHIDVDPRTGDVWAAYGASPGIPPKIVRLRPE